MPAARSWFALSLGEPSEDFPHVHILGLALDQLWQRRENRRLREDVEILKRATAFFAKETR